MNIANRSLQAYKGAANPSVLYGMYTFMGNPRIDGKWILFKNGAEIGKDKKRFFLLLLLLRLFFYFLVINADMFLWYPLRTLCSRKKSVISVLWENVEINFENLSANFFYLVVFRFFFFDVQFVVKEVFCFIFMFFSYYLHSTTIKIYLDILNVLCALMKINDGFRSITFLFHVHITYLFNYLVPTLVLLLTLYCDHCGAVGFSVTSLHGAK